MVGCCNDKLLLVIAYMGHGKGRGKREAKIRKEKTSLSSLGGRIFILAISIRNSELIV